MGNALMMRYAASRGNQNEMRGGNSNEMRGNRNEMYGGDMRGGNRSEMYGAAEMNDMRGGGNRNEMRMGGYESGMNYSRRSEMEPPEMRRRRDSRGRYMAMEEEEPERIKYDGSDTGYPEFRPYEPGERGFKKEGEFGNIPRKSRITDGLYDGGGMGFGYEPPRDHYGKHHDQKMMKGEAEWDEDDKLDRVTAERWVKNMVAPDNQQHPRGGKWTMEDTNKYADKVGLTQDEQKRVEFYAIMNARYMDDGMVLKKFGLTDPMVFACLAKAWLEDADAVEDKAAKYYKYIVKKD